MMFVRGDYQSGEAWEHNLANAIVKRAVKDYRRKKKSGHDVTDLERFFRGAWFNELTTLDGEWLLAQLEEEYEQWRLEKGK